MTETTMAPVGFIGLGTMGEPMALALRRAGTPLVVWNRTSSRTEALAAAGAEVAAHVGAVFEPGRTVLLMLSTAEAIDAVLARGTPAFSTRVRGATIVTMGITSTAYSAALGHDIASAGGTYVEAPVSGSRAPAQSGQLVAMVAGPAEAIERLRPLLAPMCKEVVPCGAVPQALALKLASNHLIHTTIAALAEVVHFARREGVDLDLFSSILATGPVSSALMRMKLPKLINRDFETQASLQNYADVVSLLEEAARRGCTATPMLDACAALCRESAGLETSDVDATAIIQAIEARSETARSGAAT